jgi:DNA-binding SARP family transcriptional activator
LSSFPARIVPPAGAAHALQSLVSRLRRSLGSLDSVAQVAGGYRLAVDADDVDALRFERLAATGRDRLRAGDPMAAWGRLGEAVALWGDHPGAEPAVVAAVAPAAATRLAALSMEAVIDLAAAETALGRADAAADRLTAVLAEQPVHERAAALLMDALAAQGRQGEALGLYERVRAALADDLGADPGAALRERQVGLLRAPAAVEKPPPGNLPAPLTSFVGRDADLTRIEALLAAGRLVTVLGPGGSGKTRLAVEAAAATASSTATGPGWSTCPRSSSRPRSPRRCSPQPGCAAALVGRWRATSWKSSSNSCGVGRPCC